MSWFSALKVKFQIHWRLKIKKQWNLTHKNYKLYTELLGSWYQLKEANLHALKRSYYRKHPRAKIQTKIFPNMKQLIVAEYQFTKTGKYGLILAKLRIQFLQHARRQAWCTTLPSALFCFFRPQMEFKLSE